MVWPANLLDQKKFITTNPTETSGMKTCAVAAKMWLAVYLLLTAGLAYAQTACPPGMVPYGAGVCGYDQSSPSPTQPSSPVWRDQFLSIASDNENYRLGVASDMPNQDAAEEAALRDCKSHGGTHCKIDLTERNGCGVITASSGTYNIQGGATVDEATKKGMTVCTKAGLTDCHVTYSVCSLGQRIQ
jgi:hypothetical protein